MIAMVSNMSGLQIPHPHSPAANCNGCAVHGRVRLAALLLLFMGFLPQYARAQVTSTDQPLPPAAADEHLAMQTVKFLAGGLLGLALHESGHLTFDVMFDASPQIKRVTFGPFPFFAITHRSDVSPRREFAISSAGFWMQDLSSEWLLARHPALRAESAPLAKGLLAFNVLNSTGYAFVAFARAGPFERDTRGMGNSIGVDERAIGALILAPAVLDAVRYFNPDARWARWASRAVKVGSVLLVVRRH
jgi:hypothetical protein